MTSLERAVVHTPPGTLTTRSRRDVLRDAALLAGGIALGGLDAVTRTARAGSRQPSSGDALRVYVIAIDSLRPDEIDAERTPTLWSLRAGGTWYESVSVLPASSTQNYAAMFTGALPQDNGFPWNPVAYSPPHEQEFRLDHLFTRLERESGHDVRTFAFSNTRGVEMFGTGGQQLPDAGGQRLDPFSDFTAEALHPGSRQQFGFLHLGDPDLVAHALPTPNPGTGVVHDAARAEREAAIRHIDSRLAEFVATLTAVGLWSRTVLVVVSDHGMDFVTPAGWVNFDAALVAAGYNPPDTGEELRDYNVPSDPDGSVFIEVTDDANIEHVADVVRRTHGVASVATRFSTPSLADLGVDMVKYPEFHSDVLAFAAEGHTFNPAFVGIHGHPLTQANVLIVAGGHPWLAERKGQTVDGFDKPSADKPVSPVGRPSVLSLAPTVAWLFDLGRRSYYENSRLVEAFDRDG